jgi:hypothetical protein
LGRQSSGGKALTSPSGAADANEGRRAGREAFLANRLAAYVTYSVCARIDFPQRSVNRVEMSTRLRYERGHMLPLERHRSALRVMLVVAPGRALARAGDDRGELPFQLSDPAEYLVAIGIQPESCELWLRHLHRLLL